MVMVLHWHSIGDSYLLGRRPRLMIWKINEFVDLMRCLHGVININGLVYRNSQFVYKDLKYIRLKLSNKSCPTVTIQTVTPNSGSTWVS